MPTNQNAYNTRLTDEALEKRFRDTFKSQGGAELVDDLYASGVIIPVVDFTEAAEGSQLRESLQTAIDTSVTRVQNIAGGTVNFSPGTGFWRVYGTVTQYLVGSPQSYSINLVEGVTITPVFGSNFSDGSQHADVEIFDFVWFLKAGVSANITVSNLNTKVNLFYRQIADVSGNLTNPSGFTSS